MTEPKTKAVLKLQLGRYAKGIQDGYELGVLGAKWRKKLGFKTETEEDGQLGYLTGFCADRFKKIVDLDIKRGEVRNVTITIRLEAP